MSLLVPAVCLLLSVGGAVATCSQATTLSSSCNAFEMDLVQMLQVSVDARRQPTPSASSAPAGLLVADLASKDAPRTGSRSASGLAEHGTVAAPRAPARVLASGGGAVPAAADGATTTAAPMQQVSEQVWLHSVAQAHALNVAPEAYASREPNSVKDEPDAGASSGVLEKQATPEDLEEDDSVLKDWLAAVRSHQPTWWQVAQLVIVASCLIGRCLYEKCIHESDKSETLPPLGYPRTSGTRLGSWGCPLPRTEGRWTPKPLTKDSIVAGILEPVHF